MSGATQTTIPADSPNAAAQTNALDGVVRVSIRNLDFFYGANKALKDICLDLPERRVTGMIGPSGAARAVASCAEPNVRPVSWPARYG